MSERLCTKCQGPVRAERSAVRLTLRCTKCNHVEVKNIVAKGYG